MSLRQCELSLQREGLVLGVVSRTVDPAGPLGVVAQNPFPGVDVLRGAPVSLLVREAREEVHFLMPDLKGRNLVRVREELSNTGLKIGTVTYREDSASFPGIILDQSPPSGSRLPLGGTIDLVASSRG